MEWSEVNSNQQNRRARRGRVKLLSAVIGTSAIVVMGTLAVAINEGCGYQ
jgi:hypothetical protein